VRGTAAETAAVVAVRAAPTAVADWRNSGVAVNLARSSPWEPSRLPGCPEHADRETLSGEASEERPSLPSLHRVDAADRLDAADRAAVAPGLSQVRS
jgi:hypothetical protein